MLLAILGGGYYFLFGKSSAGFSPEDGAYSVTLPEGWKRVDGVEQMREQIDVAVQTDDASTIVVGHYPVPPGVGKEQLRAGAAMTQQLMPKFPGFTIGPIQESSVVAGKGVSAFEMNATASGALMPAPMKMRIVLVAHESAPHLAILMVTCGEGGCPAAEATFEDVARTFEFSV
jgi:hypothetical protein